MEIGRGGSSNSTLRANRGGASKRSQSLENFCRSYVQMQFFTVKLTCNHNFFYPRCPITLNKDFLSFFWKGMGGKAMGKPLTGGMALASV